jgi:deazaflavin-dependent oxidoreductase (nitroreductase family)
VLEVPGDAAAWVGEAEAGAEVEDVPEAEGVGFVASTFPAPVSVPQPVKAAIGRYLETPVGLVVWGTGSGSRRDPDWFENLRRATTARVQVRERQFAARPRELHGGERDAMWREVILAQAPEVSRYAQKAGRAIPVAVLEPA